MTSEKGTVLISLAVLLGLSIAAWPVYGQGGPTPAGREKVSTKQAEARPEPVVKSTVQTIAPVAMTADAALAAAAIQNRSLKTGLGWLFGGKNQRGWNLYILLIDQTIGTEKDADTIDFARALSRWQRSAGLTPSGILDEETWYKMVQIWQERRSKDHTYPRPDQLLTAPPDDFYFPTRPGELRQVELQTYAAYKRMVAAAAADRSLGLIVIKKGELAPSEKYLKIISAFRSKEYQEQLRRKAPNTGRAGLAINSPHFTGRALDIYVGGEPVDTSDYNRAVQTRTLVYKWLVKNAGKFGFVPYYYEPWHWEYQPQ